MSEPGRELKLRELVLARWDAGLAMAAVLLVKGKMTESQGVSLKGQDGQGLHYFIEEVLFLQEHSLLELLHDATGTHMLPKTSPTASFPLSIAATYALLASCRRAPYDNSPVPVNDSPGHQFEGRLFRPVLAYRCYAQLRSCGYIVRRCDAHWHILLHHNCHSRTP
jgi:hypothetical protein